MHSGKLPYTLLQVPGVRSLEGVPAPQHTEPAAELPPQHCPGRWQHQRLPQMLQLSKDFFREYRKKVQVFLQPS